MKTTAEQVIPVYHFRETHHRRVSAPAEDVWAALTAITSDQLRITGALMAVRHLGSPGLRGRELFSDGPVQMLVVDEPRSAVGAAIMRPWQPRAPRWPVDSLEEFEAFDQPGWTKVLTDFRLVECDGATMLSTETRGYSTDPVSKQRFAVYWMMIRWASGLVRRDMLAAVARAAERAVTERAGGASI
ncbi:hypothetical protein ASG12_15940 [Williamsia sp. Leaf354]|uniref:hypothetical protein n=1 Tax=Williamsia sp. Leaf354 TaxID=1736349 RepID=UPI0006FEAC78|nr:hypothetical protein [Williamsia sp. Leaf354]KQR97423.1 hypothetical protein ASG12_15940 [Williamsia sp. Leaf354]